MVGCRYGAKNTLDKNYLYLAEKRGAKILAETRVVDVSLGAARRRPRRLRRSRRAQRPRGCSSSARRAARAPRRARGVGARHDGSLDAHKQRARCRTCRRGSATTCARTAESLIGVRFPGKRFDMSKGIAIGSGIHLDRFTHIEATRYSKGSDVLGLLATMLVNGKGWKRIAAWIGAAFRHPITFVRAGWPFGFARQTLIFLVMQTIDATLKFRLRAAGSGRSRGSCASRRRADPDEHPAGERVRGEGREGVRWHRDHVDARRSCSTCR